MLCLPRTEVRKKMFQEVRSSCSEQRWRLGVIIRVVKYWRFNLNVDDVSHLVYGRVEKPALGLSFSFVRRTRQSDGYAKRTFFPDVELGIILGNSVTRDCRSKFKQRNRLC